MYRFSPLTSFSQSNRSSQGFDLLFTEIPMTGEGIQLGFEKK